MQQPSERAVETPTPAAPGVERASTNSSNANRAAKRRAAENFPDEPVTMSNFMEALAHLRPDIAADSVADMTRHTFQLTELHARCVSQNEYLSWFRLLLLLLRFGRVYLRSRSKRRNQERYSFWETHLWKKNRGMCSRGPKFCVEPSLRIPDRLALVRDISRNVSEEEKDSALENV
ncbi:hypothetical protein MRX96_017238 [Rhipicephalus microplus]